MENKKFLFEEDSVWHALVVMALPAIASQLITLVYNIADTCLVIYVRYRLAPDYPFPVPQEDCFAAYEFIWELVRTIWIMGKSTAILDKIEIRVPVRVNNS